MMRFLSSRPLFSLAFTAAALCAACDEDDKPGTGRDAGGETSVFADSGTDALRADATPDGTTPDSGTVDSTTPDSTTPDSGTADSTADSIAPDVITQDADAASPGEAGAADADAATDAPAADSGITVGAHKVLNLSTARDDYFYAVTPGPDNTFYATGRYVEATDAGNEAYFFVAKLLASGSLDTNFGEQGIAKVNVTPSSTLEATRGIVVQSNGKIVVAGVAGHPGATDRDETDFALVRFTAAGAVDTTFGTSGTGIVLVDAGESYRPPANDAGVPAALVTESQWGLEKFADDSLIVTGSAKAKTRNDTDLTAVKLDADGRVITTWGDLGFQRVDSDAKNISARAARVLPDGSVILSGYGNNVDNIQSPTLAKLTPSGGLDSTFGNGGIFQRPVLAAASEVYGVVPSGSDWLGVGYGRNSAAAGTTSDVVLFKVSSTGELVTTYGTNGALTIDVAGLADNGRNLFTLPDGRIAILGRATTGTTEAGTVADSLAIVLRADGTPDLSWGPKGVRLFDLGSTNESWWAGAYGTDQKTIMIVGDQSVSTNTSPNIGSAVVQTLTIP